jgi:outer membrane protein insertion porin family
LFCSALLICEPETIARLSQSRWRNSLTTNVTRDRTDLPVDPTRGTMLRAGLAWAPPWLWSDVTFLRATAEGSYYRELKPGWVGAASVRLGNFFKTATFAPTGDFLPPEERFYAGGANTVRGYSRNGMGDVIYVADSIISEDSVIGRRVVPLGGTALSIINAEMRMPSPILARRLRLAVFVDGGALSAGNLWDLDPGDLRFTPGAGLRLNSPVGPARLDFAYHPYNHRSGPLYVAENGTLVRRIDNYQPAPDNFFGRWRIHLAVGQAF